jgi:hypothetical protein
VNVRHWPAAVLLAALCATQAADQSPKWGEWPKWGDQGDGSYRNPVIPADYSDIDCIRVGGDYYAISSTMQFSPGMVVLHSTDLVNWSILGHVVSDLTQIGPELNWSRMNRYGRGVWAGSIRYHARTAGQVGFSAEVAEAGGLASCPWAVASVEAAPTHSIRFMNRSICLFFTGWTP